MRPLMTSCKVKTFNTIRAVTYYVRRVRDPRLLTRKETPLSQLRLVASQTWNANSPRPPRSSKATNAQQADLLASLPDQRFALLRKHRPDLAVTVDALVEDILAELQL